MLKTYKIALGGRAGQGDHWTPEGLYVIDSGNSHQSHRALHISYPNATDGERARKLGVPPGGDVFIHGLPNGYGWIGTAHRVRDWTDGCIAVTDRFSHSSSTSACVSQLTNSEIAGLKVNRGPPFRA